MNFYKITKEQAALLTKFEYAPCCMFDPFVNEQTDGTYLVDEKMVTLLAAHPNFKKLTWNSLTKITDAQISTKEILDLGTKIVGK